MENKPLIIGLVGKAKSGKDTAATLIEQICNIKGVSVEREAFANAIREIGRIFGFPEETLTCQELKESYLHPLFNITPRKFMQMVGSDLFRDHLDKDCWVKLILQKINALADDAKKSYNEVARHYEDERWAPDSVMIITDVRFPNEVDMIRSQGGFIVKIERTNGGDSDDAWRQHESEKYIDEIKPDIIWYNNESSAEEWMGEAAKDFGKFCREHKILLEKLEPIAV